MKSTLTVAAITVISGLTALLMSTPNNPRDTHGGDKVNTTKNYQRQRADSLKAEIHNDSVLYCIARHREDSIRRNAVFAFIR